MNRYEKEFKTQMYAAHQIAWNYFWETDPNTQERAKAMSMRSHIESVLIALGERDYVNTEYKCQMRQSF